MTTADQDPLRQWIQEKDAEAFREVASPSWLLSPTGESTFTTITRPRDNTAVYNAPQLRGGNIQ